MNDLDGFWISAKQSRNVVELARIGNLMLDACAVDDAGVGIARDYTLLARVQWITARIDFINAENAALVREANEPFKPSRGGDYTPAPSGYNAPLIGIGEEDEVSAHLEQDTVQIVPGVHPYPVLPETDTVPVAPCAVGLVGTAHPPHTWMKQYAVTENKADELFWCVGT
jgi:hypothetical protein